MITDCHHIIFSLPTEARLITGYPVGNRRQLLDTHCCSLLTTQKLMINVFPREENVPKQLRKRSESVEVFWLKGNIPNIILDRSSSERKDYPMIPINTVQCFCTHCCTAWCILSERIFQNKIWWKANICTKPIMLLFRRIPWLSLYILVLCSPIIIS